MFFDDEKVNPVFAYGLLVGVVGAWWVSVLWRGRIADRAHFTEITERAAYVKLNEKAMKEHPSIRELDALDEEWYV